MKLGCKLAGVFILDRKVALMVLHHRFEHFLGQFEKLGLQNRREQASGTPS